MSYATDELLAKDIRGYLLWKQFYHLLNSMDRIFTVPENYKFPDFHEMGLNSLDTVSRISLKKDTLVDYYANTKDKIIAYLNELDDENLLEEVVILQEIRLTRLDVILSQFRHATWHIGYLHSCLKAETGDMPRYIGVNSEYYPV